ncbi:MAG: hypothetical protein J5686_03370 [Bacteroidales bacterium]|nr:hypothetical protein [Bacteroidales bacterium]
MSNNENKNVGFGNGMVLIVIGVLALCVTFFDIDLDWDVLIDLWPILLIIIGICIMPINKWIKTALALSLLALGIMAYQNRIEGDKTVNKVEIISSFSGDDDDDDF